MLSGLKYKLEADPDTQLPRLVLEDPTQTEAAPTSFSSRSETSYPQILPAVGNSCVVDMPGYDDNREIAQKISVGLSAHGLYHCFTTLRAIAIISPVADIETVKADAIKDTFNMVAQIINLRLDLMKNLIFVVYRVTAQSRVTTPQIVEARLKKARRDNPTYSAELQFVLENLQADQVILTPDEVPGPNFQRIFFDRASLITPQSFKDFDFTRYNMQADTFKKFIGQLKAYQQQVVQEIEALRTIMLVREQNNLLEEIKKLKNNPIVRSAIPNINCRSLDVI